MNASDATPLYNLTQLFPCGGIFCISLELKAIFGTVYAIIILLGIAGNLFVITVILPNKKMLRASINLFLLNLAIADLTNILVCAPDVVQALYDWGWLLPTFLCPVLRFLQEFSLYASVLLQVSIGIERFMAICKPMRLKRMTKRFSVNIIVCNWLLASVFALPYLLFQREWKAYGGLVSICLWTLLGPTTKKIFKYAECLILYFAPLVLLTVLYTLTARTLWGQDITLNENERQAASVLKLRRSVVRMLIIAMTLYFICYSPIQGIFVIEDIGRRALSIPQGVRLLLNAMALSSSAKNPIVYTICCRQFRTKFFVFVRRLSRFHNIEGRDPGYAVVSVATAMGMPQLNETSPRVQHRRISNVSSRHASDRSSRRDSERLLKNTCSLLSATENSNTYLLGSNVVNGNGSGRVRPGYGSSVEEDNITTAL